MSSLPPTERRNPRSTGLDGLTTLEVIELMDAEEPRTLQAVSAVAAQLAEVASLVCASVRGGGRILLAGAGTSGRIASGEAAELRATFGTGEGQFEAFSTGRGLLSSIATSEDDEKALPSKLSELEIGDGDGLIGLAASGTTPFVVAGICAARERGAWTCGIANNPQTAVVEEAELGVVLATGPEILTGSTRLQAATAQKLALNRITTAALVGAGRVVENEMVEMRVTVAKLERRAIRMVCDLAGVSPGEARARLLRSNWRIRDALDPVEARDDEGGDGDW